MDVQDCLGTPLLTHGACALQTRWLQLAIRNDRIFELGPLAHGDAEIHDVAIAWAHPAAWEVGKAG